MDYDGYDIAITADREERRGGSGELRPIGLDQATQRNVAAHSEGARRYKATH